MGPRVAECCLQNLFIKMSIEKAVDKSRARDLF